MIHTQILLSKSSEETFQVSQYILRGFRGASILTIWKSWQSFNTNSVFTEKSNCRNITVLLLTPHCHRDTVTAVTIVLLLIHHNHSFGFAVWTAAKGSHSFLEFWGVRDTRPWTRSASSMTPPATCPIVTLASQRERTLPDKCTANHVCNGGQSYEQSENPPKSLDTKND